MRVFKAESLFLTYCTSHTEIITKFHNFLLAKLKKKSILFLEHHFIY